MTLSKLIRRLPRTINNRGRMLPTVTNPLIRTLATTIPTSTNTDSSSSSSSSSSNVTSTSSTTGTPASGITTTLTNNGVLVIRLDTPNEKVRIIIS